MNAAELDAIDSGWPIADEEHSGIRARTAPRRPPPTREMLASEVLQREEAALRAELEQDMAPGERIELAAGSVVFIPARINAAGEVIARSGVRVELKRSAA